MVEVCALQVNTTRQQCAPTEVRVCLSARMSRCLYVMATWALATIQPSSVVYRTARESARIFQNVLPGIVMYNTHGRLYGYFIDFSKLKLG